MVQKLWFDGTFRSEKLDNPAKVANIVLTEIGRLLEGKLDSIDSNLAEFAEEVRESGLFRVTIRIIPFFPLDDFSYCMEIPDYPPKESGWKEER